LNNNPFKVAILAGPLDLQSAGIYVYLKMLVKHLKNKDGVEYHLIRAKNGDMDSHLHTEIIPHNGSLQDTLIRKWFRIPKFIKDNNYDLVVEPAHFGPFNLPPEIKRVTVIHDLTPLFMSQYHPTHSVIAHKLFIGRIIHKADLIIANSHNTRNDIVERFPRSAEKTIFIYPEINEVFKPAASDAAPQKYKLDKPYFLSVGTIEPRKNYSYTVQAFERYKSRNPEDTHQLVIVGRKGWKSRALLKYINGSKYNADIRIINDAHTDDLPGLYSNCSLFIQASHYEGFGFPVLEAHNCGAVCLVNRNSSLTEIASGFAHFFDAKDPVALTELMEVTLSEKATDQRRIEAVHNKGFSAAFHEAILTLSEA